MNYLQQSFFTKSARSIFVIKFPIVFNVMIILFIFSKEYKGEKRLHQNALKILYSNLTKAPSSLVRSNFFTKAKR